MADIGLSRNDSIDPVFRFNIGGDLETGIFEISFCIEATCASMAERLMNHCGMLL